KLYLCYAPGKTPYADTPMISKFWKNINNQEPQFWEAPNRLFWICSDKAYSVLPPRWKGSCTLGVIQPGFFLFPKPEGGELGVLL
ncbi:ENR1 protein, partial [Mystacornis crossleyi]|nr:ENR1 protein [Mystacornis crossleyi]